MPDIHDIISCLKKKYEQSYGFAVFDLEAEENDGKVVLRGRVLTSKQKAEAVAEIAKVLKKEVEAHVEVLSDPDGAGMGWASIKAPLADLKSRFVPTRVMNDRISDRVRASQAARGEIVRVLLEKDDQSLIQTDDLAVGWVRSGDLELASESLRERWRQGIVAIPDEAVSISGDPDEAIAIAERYLGVRYVLGARSSEAIDCSGLTQAVYRQAFGIILPRHSWDQKRMGVAAGFDCGITGDLIFMVNKKTGIKHVGILEVLPDRKNIIHASLGQGGVVRQDAELVLAEYELAEVRRMIRK